MPPSKLLTVQASFLGSHPSGVRITSHGPASVLMGLTKGNPLAEAAVAEIYRHCTSETMSVTAVSRIISRIKKAQVRPAPSLGTRVQHACKSLQIPRAKLAEQARVPLTTVAAIESDAHVSRTYRHKVESWLSQYLPELRLAA